MAGISALTNLAAMQSLYAMNQASREMYASMERLATGKKINRASDDPAGSAAVDNLKARLATIHGQIDTIDFQESYLGAREGADSVVSDLLVQLKTDVTAAANKSGLTDAEKQAYQDDATSILKTIDYLSQSTTFNGQQILAGTNSTNLGTGVVERPRDGTGDGRDATFYSIQDLAQGGKLNLVDGDIESAAKVVDAAVTGMADSRAAIGTQLKSMDSEKNGLQVELENTEAARSQIEDTDYAEETSKLVRAEVLQQAAMYIMQLAGKQRAETVLSLIK
jgi:flagellin